MAYVMQLGHMALDLAPSTELFDAHTTPVCKKLIIKKQTSPKTAGATPPCCTTYHIDQISFFTVFPLTPPD